MLPPCTRPFIVTISEGSVGFVDPRLTLPAGSSGEGDVADVGGRFCCRRALLPRGGTIRAVRRRRLRLGRGAEAGRRRRHSALGLGNSGRQGRRLGDVSGRHDPRTDGRRVRRCEEGGSLIGGVLSRACGRGRRERVERFAPPGWSLATRPGAIRPTASEAHGRVLARGSP